MLKFNLTHLAEKNKQRLEGAMKTISNLKYIKRIKLIALLLVALLLMLELPTVSFYKYNPSTLPAGKIALDDSLLGYQVIVPSAWYALVPAVEKREINQMVFDMENWYQKSDIVIPIDLSLLKKYETTRLVFIYVDQNKNYDSFLTTGYVFIARDKRSTDEENVRFALSWAEWEIVDIWHSYEQSSETETVIHFIEGVTQTRDKAVAYINVVYFKSEVGLVVIPIISPMEQRETVQSYMSEIVDSIELYEDEK